MVQRPSWQAQLSGQKIWTLVPPPECEHVCRSLQVTVTKGDISKSAAEMNSMITKSLLVGLAGTIVLTLSLPRSSPLTSKIVWR